ncbi:MAG: GNAT family N-acetyltransferase [Ruminococcaceae bacterium]|nr:GNAT family N-acetyltransferase [Oscillospiraceae bacterium]
METTVKKFDELTRDELYEILKLRCDVFVFEQHCFYPDVDGLDREAYHIFLSENGEISAYLRMFENTDNSVKIGRVVSRERKKGLGRLLMNEAVKAAKQMTGKSVIKVDAQVQAIPFYEKLGFKIVSEEFTEAGIPHKKMILEI